MHNINFILSGNKNVIVNSKYALLKVYVLWLWLHTCLYWIKIFDVQYLV